MNITECATHRGRGTWGANFDITLATVTRTWRELRGERILHQTRYELRCTASGWQDEARSFETEPARAAFLGASFSNLDLRPILEPQVVTVAPHCEILVGCELAAVTFIRDYLQLGFDGPVALIGLARRLTGALAGHPASLEGHAPGSRTPAPFSRSDCIPDGESASRRASGI